MLNRRRSDTMPRSVRQARQPNQTINQTAIITMASNENGNYMLAFDPSKTDYTLVGNPKSCASFTAYLPSPLLIAPLSQSQQSVFLLSKFLPSVPLDTVQVTQQEDGLPQIVPVAGTAAFPSSAVPAYEESALNMTTDPLSMASGVPSGTSVQSVLVWSPQQNQIGIGTFVQNYSDITGNPTDSTIVESGIVLAYNAYTNAVQWVLSYAPLAAGVSTTWNLAALAYANGETTPPTSSLPPGYCPDCQAAGPSGQGCVACNCPPNSTWNGATCACQGGSVMGTDGKCACQGASQWSGNAVTGNCACVPGASGTPCECQGPPGSTEFDGTSCQCKGGTYQTGSGCACPQGAQWNGSQCVCGPHMLLDVATNRCVCAPTTISLASGGCGCAPGATWSDVSQACICGSSSSSSSAAGTRGVNPCQCPGSMTKDQNGNCVAGGGGGSSGSGGTTVAIIAGVGLIGLIALVAIMASKKKSK